MCPKGCVRVRALEFDLTPVCFHVNFVEFIFILLRHKGGSPCIFFPAGPRGDYDNI